MAGTAAEGQGAVGVTSDGGQTWIGACLPADVGRLVDVTSFQHTHVWVVGLAPNGPVVLYSADAGRTWERGVVPNVGHLDGVAFADADHGWAVGGKWEHDMTGGPGVIVVTTDGGRTWSRQEVPDGTVALTGVAFADQKRGWATGRNTDAAQCRSVFLATTDGGVTWVPRPVGTGPGCDLLDVAVVSNNRIVVVGWGTVRPPMVGAGVTAISDDGGITWQAITEMPDIFFWKVTVHDQHVWALGQTTEAGNYGGGVYRSDDGGLTWTKAGQAGRQPLTGAAFFSDEDGWAVSYAAGCLFVTEDAGTIWRARPLGPSFSCENA